MAQWQVINCAKQGTQCFPNLDTVFDLEGDKITSDPISDLIVYQCYEVQCYVKRYYTAGKGIRAFRLKRNGKILNALRSGVFAQKRLLLLVWKES